MTFAAALFCVVSFVSQSARFKRRFEHSQGSVSIAGVVVHNYKADNKDWVVLFNAGTSDSTIERFCHGKCEFQGHPSRMGFAFAKIHGSEIDLENMLTGQPDVAYIEADQTVHMIPEIESSATSNTPWNLERIGANERSTTGRGVSIYVQDTGIRTSHKAFGGRAAAAFDMTKCEAGEECPGEVCSGQDDCAGDGQGHGSHCAGIAVGKNFGVAPGAKVYAVKTLSDQGSGSMSWQYAGIDWVTSNAIKPAVLSMSLGGRGIAEGFDTAFQAANAAGVVVVVAAGNENIDSCQVSPAFSSHAITVGATDSLNKRASYSNYGKCNDIMAPGSDIVSVDADQDTGSVALSGTSMAAPHVSGAAALLMEENPDIIATNVLVELKNRAVRNLIVIKPNDPNYFLWVSSAPAPVLPPLPDPDPQCPGYCEQYSQLCRYIEQCRQSCTFCQ